MRPEDCHVRKLEKKTEAAIELDKVVETAHGVEKWVVRVGVGSRKVGVAHGQGE